MGESASRGEFSSFRPPGDRQPAPPQNHAARPSAGLRSRWPRGRLGVRRVAWGRAWWGEFSGCRQPTAWCSVIWSTKWANISERVSHGTSSARTPASTAASSTARPEARRAGACENSGLSAGRPGFAKFLYLVGQVGATIHRAARTRLPRHFKILAIEEVRMS